MAGELSFNFADMYPNMGFMTTRLETVAEADDQHALVDNQELAEQTQVKHDPASHKTIWFAVAGIVAVVVLVGGFTK